MKRTSWFAATCLSIVSLAADSYVIEAAVNDEKFVINGELFVAHTYCFGWDEGDEVMFLDGSPYGACATATLYNKRKKNTCKVWCE